VHDEGVVQVDPEVEPTGRKLRGGQRFKQNVK
jgi:hypothetical protein